MRPSRLPEAGSHMLSQLNHGLMSTGALGHRKMSGIKTSHLTLEPVSRIKSGPKVPEAASSRRGPGEGGPLR